jgi:hypothetical protein
MNHRKRGLWLLLAPIGVLVLMGIGVQWKRLQPKPVTVYIGPFTDAATREREALSALSTEIKNSPSAPLYWIKEAGQTPPQQEQAILFYKRGSTTQQLGQQSGVLWVNRLLAKPLSDPLAYIAVTDDKIHVTAANAGTYKDIFRRKFPSG